MRAFTLIRADSPDQAVQALASHPGARLMAGATTLFDLMKLGVERPRHVVDINGIDGMDGIDTGGGRELVFGSLARMSDVAADARLAADYPALAESLWRAASQQLRNMASLGGNVLQRTRCAYFRGGEPFACNKRAPGSGCAAIEGLDRGHALLGTSEHCIATYPGDFAVALVAFDATLDVLGPRGMRALPVEALHRAPGARPDLETTLAPDEVIVRIRVPATPLGRGSTYHKIRDRESYAFALASAAVAVRLDGGKVQEARIALGGVATRPWRAREAERMLLGQRLDLATALAAGHAAFAGARVGRHNAFRVDLGARTVADALSTAARRAERT